MTTLLDKKVLFPGMGAAGAAIGSILSDVVRGSPSSFIMNPPPARMFHRSAPNAQGRLST